MITEREGAQSDRTVGALGLPVVTLTPSRTRSSWQILLESDWFPDFSFLSLPVPLQRTESQSLTSTLMAQRPMARTAFRTKSTSTSVAYSFSSARTCGPNREDGRGVDLLGQPICLDNGGAQTARRKQRAIRCPKRKAGKN